MRESRSENNFDRLNTWIQETENSIVNFLSAFAPWLAPLVPAFMTYQHAEGTLGFPLLIALAAAVVVEILGFSAVSTYLAFWFHNRKNKAEIKKAPLSIVVIAFSFYLALIVSSNVLLDTFPKERWAEISVRTLFTLQTVPAALLVAVRTQHRELLSEIYKEKQKLSENKAETSESFQKVSETEQKVSENLPKDWRKVRPTLSYEQVISLANLSADGVKKFSRTYGVDERTVTNWRAYAKAEEPNIRQYQQ